jgi:hypothetical protein
MSLRINSDFNGVTDPDAGRYIAAVEAADGNQLLEFAVGKAINDFVVGCKQDRIWDAIKASCILAGARTLAGALVPLAGTAPTNVGPFVTGDYNRKSGLVGNGSSKYLDSNRSVSLSSTSNQHTSVYISQAAGNTWMGLQSATASDSYLSLAATGIYSFNLNAATSTGSTLTGLIGQARTSTATVTTRKSGASTVVTNSANTVNTALNHFVFAARVVSGPTDYSSARLAFYSIGESLDLALLDTRVTRLIAEINFGINTGLSGASYNIDTLNYINAGYDAGGSLA